MSTRLHGAFCHESKSATAIVLFKAALLAAQIADQLRIPTQLSIHMLFLNLQVLALLAATPV